MQVTAKRKLSAEAESSKQAVVPRIPWHRQGQKDGQMRDVQKGIGDRGWGVLDLHGLSVAAAQLALQNVSSIPASPCL